VELRGPPQRLRKDNGPELISDTLAKWASRHKIELLRIQPGKPMQNGYIERFNRTYHEEILNCYISEPLNEVVREGYTGMREMWHIQMDSKWTLNVMTPPPRLGEGAGAMIAYAYI
jgi:transposase InsO family protein